MMDLLNWKINPSVSSFFWNFIVDYLLTWIFKPSVSSGIDWFCSSTFVWVLGRYSCSANSVESFSFFNLLMIKEEKK